MMYGRGQAAEDNNWKDLTGLRGWAWKKNSTIFLENKEWLVQETLNKSFQLKCVMVNKWRNSEDFETSLTCYDVIYLIFYHNPNALLLFILLFFLIDSMYPFFDFSILLVYEWLTNCLP